MKLNAKNSIPKLLSVGALVIIGMFMVSYRFSGGKYGVNSNGGGIERYHEQRNAYTKRIDQTQWHNVDERIIDNNSLRSNLKSANSCMRSGKRVRFGENEYRSFYTS